jgi:hypothetical protein
LFNHSEQRRGDADSAASLDNEKIIQGKHPRQFNRREAWVELCEADRMPIARGQEQDRLSMIEALMQEREAGREIPRLALKLSVLVKQVSQCLKVGEHSLTHIDRADAAPNFRRSGIELTAKFLKAGRFIGEN